MLLLNSGNIFLNFCISKINPTIDRPKNIGKMMKKSSSKLHKFKASEI